MEYAFIRVRYKSGNEVKAWKKEYGILGYVQNYVEHHQGVKDILVRPCAEAEYVKHTGGG